MTGAIEQLLAELERSATPATLDRVRALVAALLDAHAAGLARALEVIAAHGEAGAAIADALARDRAVEPLLLLHGVHPVPVGERVRRALDGIAPALRAQGAVAAVLAAGAIRIDALPGGAPKQGVRTLVEQALLDAAPDATIEITLGFDDSFVPVSRLVSQR